MTESDDRKVDFVPSENSSASSTFSCHYGAILSTQLDCNLCIIKATQHSIEKREWKNAIFKLIHGVMFWSC